MKKVLLYISLILFSSCQDSKGDSYSIRYYENISLPGYELVNELERPDTNGNFVKAIYKNNILNKLYININNSIVIDTVIYRKGEPFYCERYIPVYSKRDLKLYLVKRKLGNVLITYWLNIVGNVSPFVAIDSMYEKTNFSRHFSGEYHVKDLENFVQDLDKISWDIATDYEYFEFSSKQDTANVLVRLVSKSPNGINGIRGNGAEKSSIRRDSGYLGMLQFLYYDNYAIDPFLAIYY